MKYVTAVLLIAFAALTTKAQTSPGCVALDPPNYSSPGPLQITAPFTEYPILIGIVNNCQVAIEVANHEFAGIEAGDGDDEKWSINGCKTIEPGATCDVVVTIIPDNDDAVNCQPCMDTTTIRFTNPPKAAPLDCVNAIPGCEVVFPMIWFVPNLIIKGTVEPATLIFSGPVGVATPDQSITITNEQDCEGCEGTIQVGQVSTSAPFAINNDPCSNTSIPPGKTCQISVYAIPGGTKKVQGFINVPTNLDAEKERSKVAVSVTGTP